ncbi:MAG: FtsQ-type POTRA domain-containing protein [Clostridia bacterium]|nr:FtsQ-type POTRA domain-containing protein [Clostridia bacterium]
MSDNLDYLNDYEDIEFNHVERKKKKRKKKNYLLRFLIFVLVIVAIGVFLNSPFFDIKNIEVEGNRYYSDSQVINMGGAVKGNNLFWGAGAGDIKKNLKDDPYFTDVKIKRRLPDTLVIAVTERDQTAAVKYGDRYIVVDSEGTILRKSTVDPKITIITGLTINKMKVGETIGVEEKSTLTSALNMLSVMKKGDMYFKKVDVSRVIVKAYIYDTLVVKGTLKQMSKTIQSGELQKVVNSFIKNKMKRGTLNLGDYGYMSFSPTF